MQGRASRFHSWALVWWSSHGVRKVYAHVPRDDDICKDSGIQCDDEFGISITAVLSPFQWTVRDLYTFFIYGC